MKRIALISMYEGDPAPGFFALEAMAKEHGKLVTTVDVRLGEALPALDDFDVLLSSGGPGDPTELGTWGKAYIDLIEAIRVYNIAHPETPKRAFLVCHSFQILSYAWGIGTVSKRSAALWGIHPQHVQAVYEPVLQNVFPLTDFYALESRFYQVMPTQDYDMKCHDKGIVISACDDNGAMTAWQTRDGHIAATQFHPEGEKEMVQKLLDHPPVGPGYTINAAEPAMKDITRLRLNELPRMNKMLTDFITGDA